MTIKEAFEIWSSTPRNMSLANRYRTAVTTVLMKKYADVELSSVDESFARTIFSRSDAAQELKTKAASVLVSLLQWGGDHGYCERPPFDHTVASDTLPPDAICQLDPGTLKVVKTWRNPFQVQKELGISNILRAIERCGMAGGYYWSYGRDVDTFKKRQAAKKKQVREIHAAAMKRVRDAQQTPSVAEAPAQAAPVAPATDIKKETAAPVEQAAPAEQAVSVEQASPVDKRSAASKALEVFTDRELFAELERRGWRGLFSRTDVMVIGSTPKGPSSAEPGMSAGEWLEKNMPFRPFADEW